MKKPRRLGVSLQLLVLLFATLVVTPAQATWAITQQDLYKEGITYFNLQDDADCSASAATSGSGGTSVNSGGVAYLPAPSGSSNEQKAYNFLVAEAHLSPAGAAGIMGNMHAESGFDFTEGQTPSAWSDMSNDRNNAVGIVQWDGGRRPIMINWAKQQHNTDPRDTTGAGPNGLTVQLNYLWYELNTNKGYSTLLQFLQTTTDAGQAAFQWNKVYEVSADGIDKIQNSRVIPAQQYLQKYSGTTATAGTADSTCASLTSALSPDCQTSTGNARILCAAKVYDPVSYSETFIGGHQGGAAWHQSCPTVGPSCYLDCSGLVNIAVYDVFKVDLRENTDGERSDIGKYWQTIKFNQLQPGDLIQPNSGHVEIVESVQGNDIFTFAAHTSSVPQKYQVGDLAQDGKTKIFYPQGPGQLYLRYIGPGASTGSTSGPVI